MGVTVLHPQDFLRDPFSHKPRISPPIRPNPNPTRSNRRKRSPTGFQRNNKTHPCATMVAKVPAKTLVMEQVKILKRGDQLKEMTTDIDEKKQPKIDDVLSSTDRLGPEPWMVPKQIRPTELTHPVQDLYAGSAFFSSPPPSSLPVPGFFTKRRVLTTADDATTDLRRILRLDLP